MDRRIVRTGSDGDAAARRECSELLEQRDERIDLRLATRVTFSGTTIRRLIALETVEVDFEIAHTVSLHVVLSDADEFASIAFAGQIATSRPKSGDPDTQNELRENDVIAGMAGLEQRLFKDCS